MHRVIHVANGACDPHDIQVVAAGTRQRFSGCPKWAAMPSIPSREFLHANALDEGVVLHPAIQMLSGPINCLT